MMVKSEIINLITKINKGYDSDVTSVRQDEMDSGSVLSFGEAVIE